MSHRKRTKGVFRGRKDRRAKRLDPHRQVTQTFALGDGRTVTFFGPASMARELGLVCHDEAAAGRKGARHD